MNTELKFKNFVDLVKYFSDEAACVKHLENLRWNGTIGCVHCGSTRVYKCKGLKAYKCGEKECSKRFSVITGTFLENTKIPLSKWFIAIYLCFSHKKGISSCQLSRDLGITQKAAWFMLHRIRSFVSTNKPEMLDTVVEIDETYIGGKEKNKHKSERAINQVPSKFPSRKKKIKVVGVIQRGGKVIAKQIPARTKKHIDPFIKENITEGTRIISDDFHAYNDLKDKNYNHDVIVHSKGDYVIGDIYTNGIENFWSGLKRGIYGTYHQISKKHADKYVKEFAYKFSTREQSEQERFDAALAQCNGRLPYKVLIAK